MESVIYFLIQENLIFLYYKSKTDLLILKEIQKSICKVSEGLTAISNCQKKK